jgi:hypothetical protein
LSLLRERRKHFRMISGFSCEVDDFCVIMGYYGAYSGKSLTTFWVNLLAAFSRVKKLSRNIGKESPVCTLHIISKKSADLICEWVLQVTLSVRPRWKLHPVSW